MTLKQQPSAQQLPLLVNQTEAAWRVRVSARARRLSVRVYPAGRVEVVAPRRASASMVQQFVAKHRDWIDARVRECAARQLTLTPPTELLLPAITRCMQIEYRHEPVLPRLRQLDQQQLLLRGALAEPQTWSRLLLTWITEVAYQEFQQRLQTLATEYGFKFDRLQIRRQRTRWGSCSSSGTISLNLCALFLRPEALRYLMIHELCHTRHMNHSPKFWALVQACEPGYQALDKELSKAWRQVPAWVFVN
jgi:predicted metal-dependent hydrolase